MAYTDATFVRIEDVLSQANVTSAVKILVLVFVFSCSIMKAPLEGCLTFWFAWCLSHHHYHMFTKWACAAGGVKLGSKVGERLKTLSFN